MGLDARPFTFKYVELKRATNDFSPANKLGEGGFGAVYKVTLYSIYSMWVNVCALISLSIGD